MKRKWIVLLCAAAVAACSKEPNSEPGPGGTVPIELSAGMQAHQATKAPIEGDKFPEMTPAFFLTATQGTGDAAPTDWTSPYFSDKEVNSAADGTLSWPEGQRRYYPADETQKLYFYAYTPQGASVTAGTQTEAPRINYTIDGSQDIMWAANTQGIKPDGAVADPVQLTFSHRLMQVRFKVAKSESFPIGEGETFAVTSIKIKDTRVSATLDVGTGALLFPEAEQKGTLTAYENETGVALGDEAAEVPGSVMFEPQTSFFCEVTAGGTTYPNVKVTLSGEGAGQAGVGHTVTLTFKQGEISATATIAEWTDGGEGTTGEDAYPWVADGHTIVIKDLSGEADPVQYPTHEAWFAEFPRHYEEKWNANTSGKNVFGEKFRVSKVDVKGKDGSSETMTWYEAAGLAQTTYNPTGYSVCGEYYEEADQSDKGLWRLPTIRELKLIYDSRSELTSVDPLYEEATSYYWSATENGYHVNVLYYGIEDRVGYFRDKSNNAGRLRCVRDEKAEKPGQTYPYVEDGRTIVVRDDQGMADPSLYPTHEPWAVTTVCSERAWNANTSGKNTCGEKFRVAKGNPQNAAGEQNGRMNWYQAAGVIHATHNPTGYSGCGAYYEEEDQSDKGLWRLPTMRELKLIFDMERALISANIPVHSTNPYLSSVENGGNTNRSWNMNFCDSEISNKDKEYYWTYARCVRDTELPPFSADYPKAENGNTLVLRDDQGMAVPASYPTHDPWLVTPVHGESAWDANASGYNTYGERFQVASSDAKGKDGSAEDMTWFEASGTTDATNNSNRYSACAEYSEEADQSDKGLWRLPTSRELRLIYNKRGELTAANLPSGNSYWSAIESSSNSNQAWSMFFGNGGTGSDSKSNHENFHVRCVRDLGLLPVSADYPKVENGNTLVVRDDRAMASPAAYPTHAMWSTTPGHDESNNWNTNVSGKNTVGESFEVAAANAVSATGSGTMTFYEAAGWGNGTYNPTAYSACASYSQGTDDAGGWRLPTVRELKLIYDKRSELTSASIPNSNYWTMTGHRGGWMWFVAFPGGQIYTAEKHGVLPVRCVRDL